MVVAGESSIAQLARLMASKGVPPFLVASNIVEPEYLSVRLWKEPGQIYVESVCRDEETDQDHVYLYTYDQDVTLQRIEMRVGTNRAVVWDRQQEITKQAHLVYAERASQGKPAGHLKVLSV